MAAVQGSLAEELMFPGRGLGDGVLVFVPRLPLADNRQASISPLLSSTKLLFVQKGARVFSGLIAENR